MRISVDATTFFRKLIFLWILLICIMLTGCHPFVKYPYPPVVHPEAIGGAAGGAALGAEAAAAASGSVAAGMGVGAVVGGGIGTYLASTPRWMKCLQRDGVQVVQVGDRVRIILPSDKIFMFNTGVIIPQRYPILLRVTQFIKNYGPAPITVSAYSDNVGSPLAKLKLTTDQAKSVAAFLWTHGIPYQDLNAVGHGSAYPVAANNNPIGSTYNRRVEITFPVEYPHHWVF